MIDARELARIVAWGFFFVLLAMEVHVYAIVRAQGDDRDVGRRGCLLGLSALIPLFWLFFVLPI